jgi:hypothetical protein
MHSWAKWTAKTVLVTTGFAAIGGGFAGVAYAGAGGTNLGTMPVLSDNHVGAQASIPIDICGNAAVVLGIAIAGCQGGAEVAAHHGPVGWPGVSLRGVRPAGSARVGSGGTIQQAGLSASNISAGSGDQVRGAVSVPTNICGNAAVVLGDSNVGCAGGATVGGWAREPRGQRDLPSSIQLAGLGTLPGLANLPTLAGLADLPLLRGLTSGGSLLPATALSAFTSNVDAGGMSGNSFVTLAVGALLAGAAALKLAGRRSRTRKAGNGRASA